MLGGQAEPFGDTQRVRGSRPAELDPVERLVGLDVEPGRGVLDVGRCGRPLLQLGVVARCHGEPRLPCEALEQRLGKGGTLDGIGSRCDLVEEDERAVCRRGEDPGERAQVTREGREAHRDRLLVADVDEDVVEDRQRRLVGRWAQTALVERRGEPERLQRDRLPARVRARDDHGAELSEVELDRHCRRRDRARDAGRLGA